MNDDTDEMMSGSNAFPLEKNVVRTVQSVQAE
jgi:hypothetical protein